MPNKNFAVFRLTTLVFIFATAGCSSDTSHRDNPASEQPDRDAGHRDAAADAAERGGKDAAPDKSGSCDDLHCATPATCEQSDGRARCRCPDGYDDSHGDGSVCTDRDECAADGAACDKHASCENTDGSYQCHCDGPAYSGDGKSCSCAKGFSELDGVCVAADGGACTDDLDCLHGHCVGGSCCAQACGSPDAECTIADGATCEDGKTCKYPRAKDGTACDDGNACLSESTCKAGQCQAGSKKVDCDDKNPCTDDSCDAALGCKNQNNTSSCDDGNLCTSNDHCHDGGCSGTAAVDCTASADACNTGACDPATGACRKLPAADGGACDDGDSCTTSDHCAAGSCKGPDSACGPNAASCVAGAPNRCTCKPDYVESAGRCVPQNDECANSPCSPNAICFDPSNAAGDVTCKCNAGYSGDGKTCTVTEPCKDNPCGDGRGTCTPGTAGTHTCSCDAGFKSVGGSCVCDLSGTFAGRTRLDASWKGISGFEDGQATSYNWYVQRNQLDADGSVTAEIVLCGESVVDLCGTALGNEAYAQWSPRSFYDAGSAQATYRFMLPMALPNQTFETPEYALLLGISLTDPLGAWPADRKKIQGAPEFGGTATNGARWLDADGDSFIGITTYAVGPEGISADGDGPRPLVSFGPTSQACPRRDPNAKRDPYAYPPSADGLSIRRVKRFYTASRVTSALRGKIDSCDAFSGDLVGPTNGYSRVDGVVGGCVRVEGSGEAACSSQLLDFLGAAGASQTTDSSTFMFKRAPDNVTCADVRALSFD